MCRLELCDQHIQIHNKSSDRCLCAVSVLLGQIVKNIRAYTETFHC